MKFLNLFNKKGEPLCITPNIDIPKMEWNEFLDFIGYTEKDVKGNVDQLQAILTPFMVDLYKYKFNMPIDLNKRIDMFENWFENDSFRRYYNVNIKELIFKLASWYEMRYSDSTLKEMLSSGKIDNYNCFNFDRNKYIHENFSDDSDIYYLELSKTLDFGFFIKSLSKNEKEIFKKKKLSVNFTKDNYGNTYFLTPNGFIESILDCNDSFLLNKCDRSTHITDVVGFSEGSIDVYINATKERYKGAVMSCYKGAFIRKEILNCAMYKLLLSHNTNFSTMRALLFAKEFGLDIDVPMIYGVERDNYIRQEINFYLKFGGSKDLICYRNYFDKGYKNGEESLEMKSIADMIKDYSGIYTDEEKFLQQKLCEVLASKVSSSKELYQKLATVLHSCIDQDELAKEKTKIETDEDDLRRRQVIQRRLEKKLKGHR